MTRKHHLISFLLLFAVIAAFYVVACANGTYN